jgi:hypothetical protein
MSNYPIIEAIKAKEQEFNTILSSYTTNYDLYLNSSVTPNPDSALRSTLKTEVVAMGQTLNELNGLLNQAYQLGLTNQDFSTKASAALLDQSVLVERRERQFQEARDRLAHLAGEEETSLTGVYQSRMRYYLFFILALALAASSLYLFLGGNLPFALMIVLLIIGFFVTWEIYKSWLSSIGNIATSGADNIKGVFRLMT